MNPFLRLIREVVVEELFVISPALPVDDSRRIRLIGRAEAGYPFKLRTEL